MIYGSNLKFVHWSYKRYLENFFRKRFKLVGTPVTFLFREGANPYEGKSLPHYTGGKVQNVPDAEWDNRRS